MISFTKLGKMGRLGNQLFQYAFLRTQAEKLNVKFYCPKWVGDDIFNLNDNSIRAKYPKNITTEKFFAFNNINLIEKIGIQDHNEISGYFESEKYFEKNNVRKWYSFKPTKIASLKKKYNCIDFSRCVGLHLRFGDKISDKTIRRNYFVPRRRYYLAALNKISNFEEVIVFSDDIELAKKYLSGLKIRFFFIEGNKDWEDLYLMSQCRDFICGSSTLSWWGAWLNNNPYKKIYPCEGNFRPGSPFKNPNLIPKEWVKIRSLYPIIDNYFIVAFPGRRVERIMGKIGIYIRSKSPLIYKTLKKLIFTN